ncbi:MAG: SDR family oxidoreductase [Rhodobacter sp.]|jgi:NAD(P)-dependent dehydrogenase (short-subunit alcohol dehydrogenase family)|nr:SDR family oxidoreductase [Rhodobacter sp.]
MRKTVLVTGASAGIGAASARLLAQNGYDVAIAWRSDRTGAEAVARDVTAAGGKPVLLQADLEDPGEIERLFGEFDAAFPRLDALVNNAGIVAPKSRVEDMDAARLQAIFQTNVVAAFLVAGQAVRRMSTEHGGAGGAIVNMSSAAARFASPNQYVDYAASKAAIDTLTKGLAEEVGRHGIRVNAIRPGVIETEIHAKGGEPDRVARLGHTVPMGRSGSPSEVAEAVLWLLSDAASYVTGAFLDVSGGR